MTWSGIRLAATVMPPMVSPFNCGILGNGFLATSAASSGTFQDANGVAYYPILVPVTTVARRLWWANGSTVSASYNVECGIYLDGGFKPGTRLVTTGSTAQGTASQVQFVDITDTTLAPGQYWLALWCSTVSATFFRNLGQTSLDAYYKFDQQSQTGGLPSTATAIESAYGQIYLFGFATTASP